MYEQKTLNMPSKTHRFSGKARRRDDLTGRKLRCMALVEKDAHGWSPYFKVKRMYREVLDNLLVDKNVILVESDPDQPQSDFYVDAACFKEDKPKGWRNMPEYSILNQPTIPKKVKKPRKVTKAKLIRKQVIIFKEPHYKFHKKENRTEDLKDFTVHNFDATKEKVREGHKIYAEQLKAKKDEKP